MQYKPKKQHPGVVEVNDEQAGYFVMLDQYAMSKDLGLNPYEFRLLAHYKSLAWKGAVEWWQRVNNDKRNPFDAAVAAEYSSMSQGMVSNVRKSLEAKGVISLKGFRRGGGARNVFYYVEVLPTARQNADFSGRKSVATVSPHETTVSPHETTVSPHEAVCITYKTKEEEGSAIASPATLHAENTNTMPGNNVKGEKTSTSTGMPEVLRPYAESTVTSGTITTSSPMRNEPNIVTPPTDATPHGRPASQEAQGDEFGENWAQPATERPEGPQTSFFIPREKTKTKLQRQKEELKVLTAAINQGLLWLDPPCSSFLNGQAGVFTDIRNALMDALEIGMDTKAIVGCVTAAVETERKPGSAWLANSVPPSFVLGALKTGAEMFRRMKGTTGLQVSGLVRPDKPEWVTNNGQRACIAYEELGMRDTKEPRLLWVIFDLGKSDMVTLRELTLMEIAIFTDLSEDEKMAYMRP